MKTKEKILDYLAKNPMATVEDITGELEISHQTVASSLITLRKRGKVKATDS
jgi:DeoR/GlpR family transcriptional regulator of sugar metabolism